MTKRWSIVGLILGSVAVMAVGCSKNDPDGARSARSAVTAGDGRCVFDEDCPGICMYPMDGCNPFLDDTCLGYCMVSGECIADSTCVGGEVCVECSSSTNPGSCMEVCEPVEDWEPPLQEPPIQIDEPPIQQEPPIEFEEPIQQEPPIEFEEPPPPPKDC
jgi:hypothetical protein